MEALRFALSIVALVLFVGVGAILLLGVLIFMAFILSILLGILV